MEAVAVDNKIDLIRFEAKSFMGIDRSRPIILDFTGARKDKNITRFIGNQGTGKSSTMTALLYAVGEELDFKKENITNLKDDTVSLEFEFAKEGCRYRVRANKSKFTLEKWIESEEVFIPVESPKDTLKKLIGNVATSPMFLKEMDGKKQISWLRKYFSKEHEGPGRKPKEEMLLDELQQWTDSRKNSNREYERVKKALEADDLYLNREENYKRFEVPVSIEAAKGKMEESQKQKTILLNAKARMMNLTNNKVNQMKRIQDLEEELRLANQAYEKTLIDINVGEEWLKENEPVIEKEFEVASKEFTEISVTVSEYNNWLRVLDNIKAMEGYEELVTRADAKKDQIRKDLLMITKKYLPKMKGLELKIADSIDTTSKESAKEGVFLNGKSLAQISESELWEFFLEVCVHNGVNFVFIENITSLGSNAIGVLNELAARGVKIFATEQNRRKDVMQISFDERIS